MSDTTSEDNAELVHRAAHWIGNLQRGACDEQLPDTLARGLQRGPDLIAPLGTPTHIQFLETTKNAAGFTTHRFRATFRSGTVRFELGFNPEGNVNKWGFRPIPGEPSPMDGLVPTEESLREMAPRPGETAEAAQRRSWDDMIAAYKKRIAAAEA